MKWHPITDLEERIEVLEVAELRPLEELWAEQRTELEELDGMKRFRERLARSWAIETGVIERVYDLDRGTTELLIEKGIDASFIDRASTDKEPHLVAQIIRDQRETIDGLFAFIKRDRTLSTSYVKELHAALTRSQKEVEGLDQFGNVVKEPLLHGKWKERPNNPRRTDGTVHEYCPPEHVDAEMDRLIELHLEHEAGKPRPEVEAAWLHHRFTQVHPFQDGNGRVARALATLIFLRAGWFPLTIDRDRKADYIESLEAADLGNLRYLAKMFGSLQRDELVRALGIGDQASREGKGVEQIIRAAREDLVASDPAGSEQFDQVKQIADDLRREAVERLQQVKRSLDQEISEYMPEFSADVRSAPATDDLAQMYRAPLIRNAKRHHYFANPRTYHSWVRLRLADRQASTWDDLILSFHAVGREFRGLIAVSAFHEQHQLNVDGVKGDRQLTGSEDVTVELFQINYREKAEQAHERFSFWLEEVIVLGLDRWRASLARS